jgi:hypothetical protein
MTPPRPPPRTAPAYVAMLGEIDRRIDALPVLR